MAPVSIGDAAAGEDQHHGHQNDHADVLHGGGEGVAQQRQTAGENDHDDGDDGNVIVQCREENCQIGGCGFGHDGEQETVAQQERKHIQEAPGAVNGAGAEHVVCTGDGEHRADLCKNEAAERDQDTSDQVREPCGGARGRGQLTGNDEHRCTNDAAGHHGDGGKQTNVPFDLVLIFLHFKTSFVDPARTGLRGGNRYSNLCAQIRYPRFLISKARASLPKK